MKHKFNLLQTWFRRERHHMPQRANFYLRILPDARHVGKGWTVLIIRDTRKA